MRAQQITEILASNPERGNGFHWDHVPLHYMHSEWSLRISMHLQSKDRGLRRTCSDTKVYCTRLKPFLSRTKKLSSRPCKYTGNVLLRRNEQKTLRVIIICFQPTSQLLFWLKPPCLYICHLHSILRQERKMSSSHSFSYMHHQQDDVHGKHPHHVIQNSVQGIISGHCSTTFLLLKIYPFCDLGIRCMGVGYSLFRSTF